MVEESKRVFKVYTDRGLEVVKLIADLEFEYIRDEILPVQLVTIGQDEHVGDIE